MSMSNYLENKVLDHTLKTTAYTMPTTLYLALYTSDPTDADTGTEVTGGAYARQAAVFGAAVGGVASNSGVVTFPVATVSWGTVTHVGIRDAITIGNLLYSGILSVSQLVGINNQLVFNAGQISITLD